MEQSEAKHDVYKAINAVQKDLVTIGIGKDSKNKFDNYMFRGIDALYNALSPLLAKHGLCILPRILTRESTERKSAKGGSLFYVVVDAEFDFVSAKDGSKHTIRMFGEAMDRGDKATNKAITAAYKYAAFQVFAIPTEATPDADTDSPDPAPPTTLKPSTSKRTYPKLPDEKETKGKAAVVNRTKSGALVTIGLGDPPSTLAMQDSDIWIDYDKSPARVMRSDGAGNFDELMDSDPPYAAAHEVVATMLKAQAKEDKLTLPVLFDMLQDADGAESPASRLSQVSVYALAKVLNAQQECPL